MTISEFLERTQPTKRYTVRRRVQCKDGFSLSVQANEYAYCNPRSFTGPYDLAEIGFPSAPDELIRQYAENEEDLTETVYGGVPITTIDELLSKHGGIDEEKTFGDAS